jgi:hypothetical protein
LRSARAKLVAATGTKGDGLASCKPDSYRRCGLDRDESGRTRAQHFESRRSASGGAGTQSRAGSPFYRLVNPVATDDGWRPMKLVFWSPRGIGFTIHTVEALTPRSMLLAARGKNAARDVERVGRKLAVEWRVDAPRDRSTPASQTNIFCNIRGNAPEAAVRIFAREIAGSRREFAMVGNAEVKTRSENA